MWKSWGVLALAVLAGSPAMAQDLVFGMGATLSCLDRAGPGRAGRDCIGDSANACMTDTPGGESTVGMVGCLDRELSYWDDRLNASYQNLRAAEKSDDVSYGGGPGYVSKADALRAMQRAWIAYRDATCDYERAQWGGGTGGGPATLACLLHLTGEQTLYLEQMRADY